MARNMKSAKNTAAQQDLRFFANGLPKPQGSKTGFPITRKDGSRGVAMTESAGEPLKLWRTQITKAAKDAITQTGIHYRGQPVALSITFYLPRPKSHYGTGRNAGLVKESAPTLHTTKPDGDKLTRAVMDALTNAGAYTDDSWVVTANYWKSYADATPEGASIMVWALHG